MFGRPYLDTMHVDYANLIIWYLSIWWSDLETEHTVATVRISRSFLWYAMNELMHIMQKQNDACLTYACIPILNTNYQPITEFI